MFVSDVLGFTSGKGNTAVWKFAIENILKMILGKIQASKDTNKYGGQAPVSKYVLDAGIWLA